MPPALHSVCSILVAALLTGTTQAWSTYQNGLYGYELRHPQHFEVRPTGPEGERDGRSIRVAQREYAAPTPVLHVHVGQSSDSIAVLSSAAPGLTATTTPVDVAGRPGRQTIYRWRANGDIFMIDARAPGVVMILEPGAGTRAIEGTVWEEIIRSFRFSSAVSR
jgi:hypothetical protein